MKNTLLTLSAILMAISLNAQFGSKTSGKNLDLPVSVKPSNTKLTKVSVPKNLDVTKVAKLKVPKNKINLPSRKNVKITPIRPYNSNLHLEYQGFYTKNYFQINTGIATFNAQRGKEYRAKITLADKKHVIRDLGGDIPNGYALVKLGNQRDWSTRPISQEDREFNIVFTATTSGQIEIIFGGMRTPNHDGGEDYWFWMPVKSVQVDEI